MRCGSATIVCLALACLSFGCGGPSGGDRPPASAERQSPARDDAERDLSSPLPAGAARPKAAPRPASFKVPAGTAASSTVRPASGAPSDAEVRAALRQMERAAKAQDKVESSGSNSSGLDSDGLAQAPLDSPDAVAMILAGGNAIAHYPYVYGGGHRSFVDTAYDCSGSVSYALAAAGLLDAPLTSGQLARWGEPGEGRWVTIYANAGNVFMYVAGLRFDTSGRDGVFGSRWQTEGRSMRGFTVRHPPGL
jgi:hypothetical protein